MDSTTLREQFRTIVTDRAFVSGKTERLMGHDREEMWMFDFKGTLLAPHALDLYTSLFFETIEDSGSVQVGGIEVGAVPLIAGIVQKSHTRGTPIPGFFIRKSRKKYDRMRAIEGTIDPGRRIVLVDDILNAGGSIKKQVEILKAEGHKVSEVFTILRFRDLSAYAFLESEGIKITSLFELNELKELPVKNLEPHEYPPLNMPFEVLWRFGSPGPHHEHVIPKSAPVLSEGRVYLGSDTGTFWCLDQKTGAVIWSYKIPFGTGGKFTFSTPAIYKDLVYFGAYDGNLYAFNKETGKRIWTFFDGDWIGSSPAVAEDLGLVFIGLEFGLIKKRGGIAGVNAQTGDLVWSDYSMSEYTHASPGYSSKQNIVICGSNDGVAYAYNAKTGARLWTFKTRGDIKYGIAFNTDESLCAFGSFDGALYVLKTKTGELLARFETEAPIYSTPLFDGNRVYVSSLDKHVYCFDVSKKERVWQCNTYARVFSTPILIEGKLYVGANNGVFFELDPKTGKELGRLQLAERIVNRPAYDPETKTFFVPTAANELFAVRLKY